ncbi:MAG: type II toxin-antitoxin system PemK/MazF family toxin [Planctomycetes bacterium]|nr:type II toxin-antitoxin system PemK/MazF family toxin [Planctomycetota bacterium]
MSTGRKVRRGDVVLLPVAFVSGQGTKVRPAVVVQDDDLNRRLNSTVIAIVTSVTVRAASEPSQLFVDVSTPEGQATGLLRNSTVKAEHLDTIDQRDIIKTIGRLSDTLLQDLEGCIKTALRLK